MAEALAVVKVGKTECGFLKLTPTSRTAAMAGAVSAVTLKARRPSATNRMRLLGRFVSAASAPLATTMANAKVSRPLNFSDINHLVGTGEQRDELAPVGRPLLTGGLRRRLPRNEFPALRRFCPGVEEHEPQAARLAVDLCLDRRTPGDESGVARNTHLAIAADRALVLRLSRAQGGKPHRLVVGESRGVGIKKLVVEHRLKCSEVAAAHRRVALILEVEDFLIAAHRQTSLAVSPCASSLHQLAWRCCSISWGRHRRDLRAKKP